MGIPSSKHVGGWFLSAHHPSHDWRPWFDDILSKNYSACTGAANHKSKQAVIKSGYLFKSDTFKISYIEDIKTP